MSGAVFLDTSGWLAAVSPREPAHARARAAYAECLKRGAQLVTTALVVAELHTLLLRFHGPGFALEFLDRLAGDPSHDVVDVDRDLRLAAVERWLRPYDDQAFSLTDAVSFEVMRRGRIRRALALDRHFATAGFEIL
jgi:predicted nucleic acid-binding protein